MKDALQSQLLHPYKFGSFQRVQVPICLSPQRESDIRQKFAVTLWYGIMAKKPDSPDSPQSREDRDRLPSSADTSTSAELPSPAPNHAAITEPAGVLEEGGVVANEQDQKKTASKIKKGEESRDEEGGYVGGAEYTYTTKEQHREKIASWLALALLGVLTLTILIHYSITAILAHNHEADAFEI